MSGNVAGEFNRGVNWFEGGRRISKLLMVIVLGVGAFVLIDTTHEIATFATTGPSDPWHFESQGCTYPNDSRFVTDSDVSAAGESVELCFKTLQNGEIPYAIAPEPADAALARVKQEAQDKAAIARGDPPPVRPMQPSNWYYSGNSLDEQVMSYENEREKSFRLTPEMAQQVRDSSDSRLWAARREAFRSGAPWVFGIIAFIWVVTAVIGWIVRGFTGVPRGSDFRPREAAE